MVVAAAVGFAAAVVAAAEVVVEAAAADDDDESALSDCSRSELLCLSAQEHRAVSAAKSIRIYFFIG